MNQKRFSFFPGDIKYKLFDLQNFCFNFEQTNKSILN